MFGAAVVAGLKVSMSSIDRTVTVPPDPLTTARVPVALESAALLAVQAAEASTATDAAARATSVPRRGTARPEVLAGGNCVFMSCPRILRTGSATLAAPGSSSAGGKIRSGGAVPSCGVLVDAQRSVRVRDQSDAVELVGRIHAHPALDDVLQDAGRFAKERVAVAAAAGLRPDDQVARRERGVPDRVERDVRPVGVEPLDAGQAPGLAAMHAERRVLGEVGEVVDSHVVVRRAEGDLGRWGAAPPPGASAVGQQADPLHPDGVSPLEDFHA